MDMEKSHKLKGKDYKDWSVPPTYHELFCIYMFVGRKFWSVTEGTGRWAGEETAEVTPIVSPDTRVMWDVTTENLENIMESDTRASFTKASPEFI